MRVFDLSTDARMERLQRQLPTTTRAACTQVAWRIHWRLPEILAAPDWQAALVREIRTQLNMQLGPLGGRTIIAAILMVIAAVAMLVAAVAAGEKVEQLQTEEKLKESAKSLLEDVERQELARPTTSKYYLVGLPHSYCGGGGRGGYAAAFGRGRP